MNYLVTGAAGFIGSNFVRELAQDQSVKKIVILDCLSYASSLDSIRDLLASPRFDFVQGDILNHQLVSDLIDDSNTVVNFAAESHVDRSISSAEPFFQTNVLGTVSILEAIRKQPSKTMIQISTDEVYGSLLDGFATEDSPLAPNSPYSSSKAGADLICRSYVKTYNLDIRVTRCTNNFGPYQNPEKLIPKIITNLILGRRVPIYGNGQNVRDWIHVSDHVDGILKVVKGGRPGDVFNIGSNNLRSNLQVVQTILEIMGLGEDYIEFVADRPGHDFRYALDYGFIQAECGYNANVDFISGIRDTVEWYRSSRAWWEPLLSKA